MAKKKSTKCDMHSDCFAFKGSKCVCLNDTDWGNKECPFYKPESEVDRKQMEADIKAYGLMHSGDE